MVIILFLCACRSTAFVSSAFVELRPRREISKLAPLLGDWSLVCEPSSVALETDLSLQVECFDSSLMPCMDLLLSQEGFHGPIEEVSGTLFALHDPFM